MEIVLKLQLFRVGLPQNILRCLELAFDLRTHLGPSSRLEIDTVNVFGGQCLLGAMFTSVPNVEYTFIKFAVFWNLSAMTRENAHTGRSNGKTEATF